MSSVTPSAPAGRGGPRRVEQRGPGLSPRFVIGVGLVGLGLAMLGLGIAHAFAHGTCSTTGYSRYYGPVPHCAKGIGWWVLMLFAGVIVGGAGSTLAFAATGADGLGGMGAPSLLSGALLAAVGVGGAFGIASAVSSGIGKTTTPTAFGIQGLGTGGVTGTIGVPECRSEVASLSGLTPELVSTFQAQCATNIALARQRAIRTSICREAVNPPKSIVSAAERASLSAQCVVNPQAAQQANAAAVKRAALAKVAASCRQAGASSGLPAAAASTLAKACANPASGQGAGLQSAQAQICRQIVEAQVPVAQRQIALSRCPK